ncbi:dual oxidase-like [Neodiprion fabricii]|uniref:dual oxidase-like n=1 Tax=Neodiprion fabricii TaxID=2872261 RepID=UPI001ED8C7E0|nr:dual oxidase-like [Neodiprion fabricii]
MFVIILLLLYYGIPSGQPQIITKPPDPHSVPPPDNGSYKSDLLLNWLISGCSSKTCHPEFRKDPYEYEGFDGWYNNFGRPDLGAVDTPLLRRSKAAYRDGVYQPSGYNRPNPLELSENLLNGTVATLSNTGRNAFLVFFGQQVVEEILDAQRAACPPEYFNIKIPENHRYLKLNKEMPVLRTRYDARTGYSPNNPRQQLNEITPYLDGGLIYGTTKAWSDVLRTNKDGKIEPKGLLAASDDGLFPIINNVRLPMANPPPPHNHSEYINRHYTERVDRFFRLGNPRGNENPYLFTFGVLWFRWHNYIANHISKFNKDWSSDKIFNEARKWVIASQQHIVVEEWLPEWLGSNLEPYKGYDPSVDPQIDQFFQAAAFRFGHTLVPAGVQTRKSAKDKCGRGKIIRTCNSFWRPMEAILEAVDYNTSLSVGMERLIMGMTGQLCETEDHKIVEDLRGNVFGPLEFSRRDLMAINIQRARDHGLPDYNTVREIFGLSRITKESDFVHVTRETQQALLKLYNKKFDDIDLWVGGIMETNNGPGELFQKIIKDQFQRIRDGDRFWYNNGKNGLFTEPEIMRIKQLSFYHILLAVTDIKANDIQRQLFKVPTKDDDVKKTCNNEFKEKTNCFNTSSCFHITPRPEEVNKIPCSQPGTYDYFSTSDVSFILTFLGLSAFIVGLIVFLGVTLAIRRKKLRRVMPINVHDADENMDHVHSATEWINHRKPLRPILITLNVARKKIEVANQHGSPLRALDMNRNLETKIYIPTDEAYVMIKVEHNYDLIIKFANDHLRNVFLKHFDRFSTNINMNCNKVRNLTKVSMLKQAVTQKDRQKQLDRFFRSIFALLWNHTSTSQTKLSQADLNKLIGEKLAKDVMYTELTLYEFAEVLSMPPESNFVKKMFEWADNNKNGLISFREFIAVMTVFYNGSAEEKTELLFNMYDINAKGTLSRDDFANLLRSLVETYKVDLNKDDLDQAIRSTMHAAGLADKQDIDLMDFQRLLKDYKQQLKLEFNIPAQQGKAQKLANRAQGARESFYNDPRELRKRVGGKLETEAEEPIDKNIEIIKTSMSTGIYWYPITKYIADKQLQIFWLFLYTTVLIAIFAERAYYYQVEREHTGLRRISGPGVTLTRGAASAMMFTYATLLVTMSQNTITVLRETFLHQYIPFDLSLDMHKYVAIWALVFTMLHVMGHAVNFYHISTQTADDLTCLFPNFFHSTHEIPKFHYWCWQTITGITGVVLTILTAVMFLFSIPLIRRRLYNWFRYTHSMYPIFFILMILHGTGRLVQEPFTHYYLLGPLILFTIDKIITVTRKTSELQIVQADCLPSGVTCLKFEKPSDFQYKSGQWIRIACTDLNPNEYHPFTLSSSPNEPKLSVHIRAVGPWTHDIRYRVDPTLMKDSEMKLPKIRIDGPYGESAQDWYKYKTAIMIGGGIGVTPFSSILKDIVYKSNIHQSLGCQKVYFLWITRTQRQFEWMVDILRELEVADKNKVVTAHIFITQFYEKFDVRTVLLYMCERYFHGESNRSLFTGLEAVTHFGRPDFLKFFRAIRRLNSKNHTVGVFSCGSRSMVQSVGQACTTLNRETNDDGIFKHHYQSF